MNQSRQEKENMILRFAGKQAARVILTVLAFWLTFAFFNWTHSLFVPWDDTDDEQAGERSGAQLVTDYATGCQYLSNWFGGMTKRLDRNGNHMCGGRE